MDRIQSQELYDRVTELLKFGQLQDRLRSRNLWEELGRTLQQQLHALCPIHDEVLELRSSRRGSWTSFFMGCPKWQNTKCATTRNVEVSDLNAALAAIGACCTTDGCDSPVEAHRGRTGVYFRCTSGHFINLKQ